MDKENNKMTVQGKPEDKALAQTETMINLLTKCGVLADGRIGDERKRKAQQEKKKNSYHNTLMLLRHYRTIVWVMECFPETIEAELDRPLENLDALLSRVDAELPMGNRRLENRLEEAKKSRLLIDRVNEALTVMQYTAWAVLFLVTVWQLFRVFGGPVTEAENPWTLLARGGLFALLIAYAKPVFLTTLDIAR